MTQLLDDPVMHENSEAAPVPSPTGLVSPDRLQGLETLVDLFTQTCEMINQGVLSVESALSTVPIADEAWVPIPAETPGTPAEDTCREEAAPEVAKEETGESSEQRVFNGISVTIMKLGVAPPLPPASERSVANQDQLGYGRLGGRWAILIREAGAEAPISLVEAPLEMRLRGIRAMSDLIARIGSSGPAAFHHTGADVPAASHPLSQPIST